MKFIRTVSIFFFSLWLAPALFGCPCGCGSVFSLSMYPGEQWKFRVASSRQYFEKYVQADGSVGEDLSSPRYTDTLQLSVAKAWTDKISTFVSLPVERNWHEEYGSHMGMSDPSLGVRWLVNPYDMSIAYLPQVTLHVAYKHPVAKTLDDQSSTRTHELNVHSNGWQEILPGADLSFYWGTWIITFS